MHKIQLTFLAVAMMSGSFCHAQEMDFPDSNQLIINSFDTSEPSDNLILESVGEETSLLIETNFAFNDPSNHFAAEVTSAAPLAHQKLVQSTIQFMIFAIVLALAGVAGFRFYSSQKMKNPHRWNPKARRHR